MKGGARGLQVEADFGGGGAEVVIGLVGGGGGFAGDDAVGLDVERGLIGRGLDEERGAEGKRDEKVFVGEVHGGRGLGVGRLVSLSVRRETRSCQAGQAEGSLLSSGIDVPKKIRFEEKVAKRRRSRPRGPTRKPNDETERQLPRTGAEVGRVASRDRRSTVCNRTQNASTRWR